MTHLGLKTPDKGAVDWHLPLNDNFGILEDEVIRLGDRLGVSNLHAVDGYHKPSSGSGDWDIPLNENFGTLIREDVLALGDAAAGVPDLGGYHTPAEGTPDWHLKLNDNFRLIHGDLLSIDQSLEGYHTGSVIPLSEFATAPATDDEWLAWIDASSPKDILDVDIRAEVDTHIMYIPPDRKVISSTGSTIRNVNSGASGSTIYTITPNGPNVWFDGLTVDGGKDVWPNQRGGSALGITFVQDRNISNFRCTNCEIFNGAGNGVTFTGLNAGNTIQDLFFGFNHIHDNFRHGLICGSHPPDGAFVHDISVYKNFFEFTGTAIACTTFGGGSDDISSVTNDVLNKRHAFIWNTIHNVAGNTNGSHVGFEDLVAFSLMYGNELIGDDPSNGAGGFVTSKGNRHNLVARNFAESVAHGTMVWGQKTRDFKGNRFVMHIGQDIRQCRNALRMKDASGHITFSRIHEENNDNQISRSGTNSGEDYEFTEIGPDVPLASTGVPDSVPIEHSVAFDSVEGDHAEASWAPGSPFPDEPVTIAVTVDT